MFAQAYLTWRIRILFSLTPAFLTLRRYHPELSFISNLFRQSLFFSTFFTFFFALCHNPKWESQQHNALLIRNLPHQLFFVSHIIIWNALVMIMCHALM